MSSFAPLRVRSNSSNLRRPGPPPSGPSGSSSNPMPKTQTSSTTNSNSNSDSDRAEQIRKLREENGVLGRAIEELLKAKRDAENATLSNQTNGENINDVTLVNPLTGQFHLSSALANGTSANAFSLRSLLQENKSLKQRLLSWKTRALEENSLVNELRQIVNILPLKCQTVVDGDGRRRGLEGRNCGREIGEFGYKQEEDLDQYYDNQDIVMKNNHLLNQQQYHYDSQNNVKMIDFLKSQLLLERQRRLQLEEQRGRDFLAIAQLEDKVEQLKLGMGIVEPNQNSTKQNGFNGSGSKLINLGGTGATTMNQIDQQQASPYGNARQRRAYKENLMIQHQQSEIQSQNQIHNQQLQNQNRTVRIAENPINPDSVVIVQQLATVTNAAPSITTNSEDHNLNNDNNNISGSLTDSPLKKDSILQHYRDALANLKPLSSSAKSIGSAEERRRRLIKQGLVSADEEEGYI